MNLFKTFGGLLAVIILAIISMSVFTVDKREQAIVLKFGEIVRVEPEPGLKWKLPFINNVVFFDNRIHTMDSPPQNYLTLFKKTLVVDSFVKWRIKDVERYYIRVQGSIENARTKISSRVNKSLRDEVARRSVHDVVSGDRVKIMNLVRKSTSEEVDSLGIEIVDVRMKRVDFDPNINDNIYERMRAERTRVAKALRAEGNEEAEKIRAGADRERTIMLAEANQIAEQVKGEGDASATGIYAQAFNKDKEFFKFYKSLDAYKNTFNSKQDLFIIDPNSEFMQYLKQSAPTN